MMERLINLNGEPMPPINPGEVLRVTQNFRVVTDYKPGLEGQRNGERFYIEPLNVNCMFMMWSAAMAHNIYNFDTRIHPHSSPECTEYNPALRADYCAVNISVLFQGLVRIPEKGKDTIPSPDRMEACIQKDGNNSMYTFGDDIDNQSYAISNPMARRLRLHQALCSDDIPSLIVGSYSDNPWYKARKGWWTTLGIWLREGVKNEEFTDPTTVAEIEAFIKRYDSASGFLARGHRTEAVHIAEANALINKIWEMYGNK